MIDTGAAPNVIKQRALNPETIIDNDDPLLLSGITSGRVETLGSVEIHVHGYPVTFHVVPDDFPIAQEGILGGDFLCGNSKINLVENILEWKGNKYTFTPGEVISVPARSRSTFYPQVKG